MKIEKIEEGRIFGGLGRERVFCDWRGWIFIWKILGCFYIIYFITIDHLVGIN